MSRGEAMRSDAPTALDDSSVTPPSTELPRLSAPSPRYELLFELASGGMGTVHVGRRLGADGFQRLVAIKRVKNRFANDPQALADFRQEAQIASLLQHKNVVSIHDLHEQDGELLLAMDYVDGVSLAALMRGLAARRKRLSQDVSLRIIYDALAGLHAAHELRGPDGASLGLVHRDATPHNILLGVDGSVRLADFGIAHADGSNDHLHANAGEARGKLAYMAPEHAFGEPLDRRADVFAVGVALWELLTGRRLFRGRALREVAREAALGNIPLPSEAGARCGHALDRVVERALAPWREDRWPTAKAFADELSKAAHDGPGLAPTLAIADVLELVAGDELRTRREQVNRALQAGTESSLERTGVRRLAISESAQPAGPSDDRKTTTKPQPEGEPAELAPTTTASTLPACDADRSGCRPVVHAPMDEHPAVSPSALTIPRHVLVVAAVLVFAAGTIVGHLL